MSSEESTMSEAPVSPDGEDSTAAPEYEANDSTEVCTELAEQSAPILMKALENADKPDAITAAYSELAALYEDGVGKVESQKAKDAFTAMAEGYRAQAKGGIPDSAMLNEANEKLGAACFGG